MSEELQWELYDIFASGIFAFPVYEHSSARRIVRYLLMRGVPDEDVASAIEGHTLDLRMWLSRTGKRMVGEWVIAWLNERREHYKYGRHRGRSRGSAGKSIDENDGGQSEFIQERNYRRRHHRQRDNSPGLFESEGEEVDGSDGEAEGSDISSVNTSTYHGSVTSISSDSSSVISNRNGSNALDSMDSRSYNDSSNIGNVKSENRQKNNRKGKRGVDICCSCCIDTNLCRNIGRNDSSSQESVIVEIRPEISCIESVEADDTYETHCQVETLGSQDDIQEAELESTNSERHPSFSFSRLSPKFRRYLHHSASALELTGSSFGTKKLLCIEQKSSCNKSEIILNSNNSANYQLFEDINFNPLPLTRGNDSSTVIWHDTQNLSDNNIDEIQSYDDEWITDDDTTKQCTCTLPHYTRKNNRNNGIANSRSNRCSLCRNYRPIGEVPAAPTSRGPRRRKGGSCMFWKVPWIA